MSNDVECPCCGVVYTEKHGHQCSPEDIADHMAREWEQVLEEVRESVRRLNEATERLQQFRKELDQALRRAERGEAPL